MYQYQQLDIHGQKHRRAITAKTRATLEQRIAKLDITVAPDITLREWIQKWLAVYVDNVVKDNTIVYYRRMLAYIPTGMQKRPLATLTPLMCQSMLMDLLDHGRQNGGPLSTSTVRSIRSTLITCLDSAKEAELLKTNPVKATKPPRLIRKEKVFLSPAQAQRLLAVAEKGSYYVDKTTADPGQLYLLRCYAVLVRLALVTGMRRGELLGLTWPCVGTDTLSIRYQEQYSSDKGYYLGTPKTQTSIRTISLDYMTMKVLNDWHQYQKAYASMLGNQFRNPNRLVLTNAFGTFVHPDNFRCRHWAAMCRAADLPKGCTLHSLRHTAATLMLQAGVDIKTCAQRLGHANATMLLKVYAHVLSENDAKAADTLAGLITNSGNKKSDCAATQSDSDDSD
ncbi:site-specific integrase [uncultured Megasphaera sp.]|uniref:tyrosine-type recombinase/integrase n=1 Tax=uncultured Megasphaera sp. TaxID=165188 RepID=UPI0026384D51|nr:site-specific integrase [uncultured Megasphaera sp.]